MRSGTREWATKTVNIAQGCEHNCRYCYARYSAVSRFGTVASADDWPDMQVVQKRADRHHGKYNGVVMFPSTHDITPSILPQCLTVLRKLLEAGNQVLIVSKPHLECIQAICEAFERYKQQIQFRFSIGSASDDVLKFWEPNAPSFGERSECLVHAHHKGFATSISAEPFLDAMVRHLYRMLQHWITDSFWIGKLNDFEHRVDMSQMSELEKDIYVQPLLEAQTDEAIRRLYADMNGLPFVRWKDSIREVIEKYET